MWKIIAAAIIVTVGCGIALLVDTSGASNEADVPGGQITRSESVDLGVRRGASIFATGRIEGASQEIQLRAPVAGRATNILVKEGEYVSRDQVLLQVEDDHQKHAAQRAAAELELAEAELHKVAEGPTPQQLDEIRWLHRARTAHLSREMATWERTEELLQSGTITSQEADDQRARLDAAKAEAAATEARLADVESRPRPEDLKIAHAKVATARAAWQVAQASHQQMMLRSPVDAQVLKINARLGEMVGPNLAEPQIILADTSSYRVRAFVDEIDAPRLKLGLPVAIRADGLDQRELQGTIASLGHRMQPKPMFGSRPTERYDTKSREVWIDITSQEPRLIIGLRVDVYIYLEEG